MTPTEIFSTSPVAEYIAPVSGYYVATVQMDFDSFNFSTSPILGVPVGNPQILVNNAVAREAYTPFLAFNNEQHSTFSSLLSLKAGDVVTTAYNVYVMSDTGFTTAAGTGLLLGNGTEANQSLFKIHYLSSDCPPNICQPCTVPSPCTPCPSTACCS